MYAVRLSLVALVCVLASFTGFPATPLRADSPDLTNFAGEWDGHGFELNVGPDGQAVAVIANVKVDHLEAECSPNS
jgi:hypothetical protein